ncbi:S-layer homology domain-containing protein [Schnuerera sp.]|uniref:S-layer homology domain-containing protein n=1 Tax=Schnuerera sp. TaxID=2794844 RepID=UPI002BAC262A|nr:S-layer homology domain-containing protein [Schnuerera sp.]HSH34834.1 S-layer homology domain-containing protein [Schnuerera sp.]
MKGNNKFKFIAIILAFGMIFSQFTFFIDSVEASRTDLLITGTGVNEEVRITESDWSKYEMVERIYSGNNSLNFHKIIKAKGYDLFDLIGENNLKTNDNYQVKFTCSDGFEFTKSINELKNTYYFSDFTDKSKEKSEPMIARYTAVLADYPKDNFLPPIKWDDRNITEKNLDKGFPKLVFGQTNVDDMNLSQWGKEVVKITIGEDKPIEKATEGIGLDSSYKHISHDGAPYNIDAITGATFTIEGPAVEGYRAISLRQIEEDTNGQEQGTYYEKVDGKVVQNTYEGINGKHLIDNYVKVTSNAGNVVFKDKSRKTIRSVPIGEVGDYLIAYGINEVPLVYLDTDVGYKAKKHNDNGCFKLVYEQDKVNAKEFSNVAYIYIEEKDAKNIYEHTYPPYDDPKYTDYEIIIHGDKMDKEIKLKVSDIEAMDDIKYEGEYSLSNSEYFWYYNKYKGVPLWDLLLKVGIDPNIDEDTSIQFIAADHYNFPPMTIGEIKDSSLYGYYEKNAEDVGDGTYDGSNEEPLHTEMPVLVTYGFNGYPYVVRPTDEGFNPGLGNDGGPLRVIFGKTSYNDPNGANQVQFLKEIIIGGGDPVSTETDDKTGQGESTQKDVDKSSTWNHNQGVYTDYLDMPVLRVTGSQVKEPMTFTLRQIESMTEYALRDVYTGDGIREFEGVVLWDIISKVVGLKDDVDVPSIRVFSGQNYNQILRSSQQVMEGVLNSKDQVKKIILAYAVDGHPLVPNESDIGYVNNNAYGPIRLIIEESKSMWVKWTDCIVVGTGDYEEPKMEDVKELDLPELSGSEVDQYIDDKIWITYRNDTGKELPEASVRSMEYDKDNNLWIGTNNGGLSLRTSTGKWITIKEIETENAGIVKVDTCYAIVQRENGELWITLGGALTPQGILVKNNDTWKLLNTKNSELPANFVQELELDKKGGLWIGTQNGAVYVDKDDNWTVYTEKEGLLPYSVDAIEPDKEGGAWIGYYPDVKGDEENPLYIGGYQHIAADGTITTYEDFDNTNFNLNWVRSISIDDKGGVWVVRSGNAPGFGQGEVDYILNGERKVYTAKDLYPTITEDDDIRLVLADKENEETLYIATTASGVIKTEGIGKVAEIINASNQFPSKQWNNVYFLDWDNNNLLVGTNGGAAVNIQSIIFKDIESHWAKKEIQEMATMGYIKGSNDEFNPDNDITRAEFVAIMVRILGLDTFEMDDIPFNDVKSTDWFAKDVVSAEKEGIIKGYEDGTFKPNSPIERQEIAVVLANFLEELNEDEIEDILLNFDDDVEQWARNSLAAVIDAEIIKGLPNNTVGGQLNATRAETIVILLRFLKY